ncbi:MAG: BatA domain-containing protein, partial [Burkholderiales bacterium]|nr:BatA domain-containing protein [Burkholderiales bacterium]
MNFAFAPGIVAALFAAVAAIVTALYLLRPPPRRITIASTLIWDRVLKHKRRDSERWRWWLSLALSLVIALALAAALSRPDAIGIGGAPQRLILVVDNAPTMAALRTDGRTRLDHARDEARRLVQTADTGTAFLVVDTMRSIGSPAFESADAALARIDALQVAVGGFASYPDLPVTDRSAGTIDAVLITDGVTPLDAPDDVRQVSVFEPVSNVGITGFDVRANVADPRRVEAFVELANADGQPTTVGLTLTGAGRPPIRQQVEVPARGFANLTVPVSSFTGGALQASIDAAGDGLALDDIAYAVLPGGRTLKVALVTAGDRALERALRLDPRVELTVLSPVRYAPQSGIDVYVFDRFVPPVPPIAPMLLLRPEAATWLPPADTAGGASRIAD